MTKVLHLADTHIGTRQYGLEERRRDFARAFQQAIKIAIEEEVAAVIHAGDLFDSRYPSTEDLQDVLQALDELRPANIPFLAVVGNHEHKRGLQWLDLLAALGLAVHLSAEPFDLKGIPVYGLDYSGRQEVKLPEVEPGAVLVMHQLLDKVDPVRGELKLSVLAESGARLALLGDYHEHKSWREKGLLVTYPGSTERWRATEVEPRGCSLIDLETGRLERRLLRTRPFIYISEEDDPLREIAAREGQIRSARAVVCVYLAREGPTVKEIEEAALAAGALAVQVFDRRQPEVGVEGETGEEPRVDVDVEELEELLARRLAELELSPLAREVEAVIRDERIADSNVDPEVMKLLEREDADGPT